MVVCQMPPMKARILLLLLGIALSATVAQAQPVISFETNEIVVSGALGHPVVLLLEGTRGSTLESCRFPDADGLSRFPVKKGAVMNAIAVDVCTGSIGFNSIGISPQSRITASGLVHA